MERSYILHMFTPGKQMSPFDINMAVDAGYQVVVPYCGVTLDEITGLTQDAIFSRGPKGVKATGIFIGGRDVMLAADMLDAARKAMVPPFEVSVIADPSGSYTTAAALVACVEQLLRSAHGTDFAGKEVLILGGTALFAATSWGVDTLANSGAHGFSEILYAFTSAANNNGSAFAGLSANTPFYNVMLAIAMWFGRFGVIVPVLAVAGSLAAKQRLSANAGTMPTHGPMFIGLLIGVVVLVGVLNYVPALALGPIVEHLQLFTK